jgi:pimeloyl-ACP methyl ester carboxylesterase
MIPGFDSAAACRIVDRPTLVVRGEDGLDHVVDPTGTAEYRRLIRGAQEIVLERTGHLGSITRPDAFASIVSAFIANTWSSSAPGARPEPGIGVHVGKATTDAA